MIQHIIEQSRLNKNNELWIILQDLSKACDRTYLFFDWALQRVNLPNHITNFFCDLFTNRINKIILPKGLSTV